MPSALAQNFLGGFEITDQGAFRDLDFKACWRQPCLFEYCKDARSQRAVPKLDRRDIERQEYRFGPAARRSASSGLANRYRIDAGYINLSCNPVSLTSRRLCAKSPCSFGDNDAQSTRIRDADVSEECTGTN